MNSPFSHVPLSRHFVFQRYTDKKLAKSSSCSTIFIDDSTISHPDLKNTIKCVTIAIYYHIRSRTSDDVLDIFDEKLHPLSVSFPGFLQATASLNRLIC